MLPILAELPLQQEWAALSKFRPSRREGVRVLCLVQAQEFVSRNVTWWMDSIRKLYDILSRQMWNLCWRFIDEVATKRQSESTASQVRWTKPKMRELGSSQPSTYRWQHTCPKTEDQTESTYFTKKKYLNPVFCRHLPNDITRWSLRVKGMVCHSQVLNATSQAFYAAL